GRPSRIPCSCRRGRSQAGRRRFHSKGSSCGWQQPGRFAGTGAAAETADFPSGLLRRWAG
ncbi:MAG: hypothetical protein CW346_19725, partial [Bacillaceae bacterium]|nr:hypothetical protein [Bacillaceae bacterium]